MPADSVETSFVIPLFNCLELTQAMVASLRATLPAEVSHEIILVDDGSTDGTRAWLDTLRDPPFRVLLNDSNLGYAATNNRAATLARGRRLVLLNNDLVLLPGWYEPMRRAHDALGRRAGLVGNVQLNARSGDVDHAGIDFSLKAKPEHVRVVPGSFRRRLCPVRTVPAVTAACLMIDAELWQELGGFDERFVNGGEDVDLCFRARARGRRNVVALRSVVRHHVSSSTGRKLRDEANSELLARRWRDQFVRVASPRWCRAQLEPIFAEPRDFEPQFAWRVWRCARGWSRTPPREAVHALNRALELEFVRWKSLRP